MRPGLGSATREVVPADRAAWVTGRVPPPGGVVVEAAPTIPDVMLADWLVEHRPLVRSWLLASGAVRFRGFGLAEVASFRTLAAAAWDAPLLEYEERSSPRTRLDPGVYTSTEQPADQPIALHNESSYRHRFPARLAFGCLRPADAGGATLLADGRRMLATLPGELVDRFRRTGVRYVRTFGTGLGLDWSTAFGTGSRAAVDAYCQRAAIATTWHQPVRPGAPPVLRTHQVRPATLRHPDTGDELWFNHAGFAHPAALDPAVRRLLVEQLGPDRLPWDVSFGDGTPISDEVATTLLDAYRAATCRVDWQAGDLLLLDNLRVAHGREPYVGDRRLVVALSGEHSWAAQPGPLGR